MEHRLGACSLAMEHCLTNRQLVRHTPGRSIPVFPVGMRSLVNCKFLRTLWLLMCKTALDHFNQRHHICSIGPLQCSFRDVRGAITQQSQKRNANLTKHIVWWIRRESSNPSQASVSSAVGAMKVCYPRFLRVVLLRYSVQSSSKHTWNE